MYHPTTRVLTVLEMLQARQRLSGNEIAERLEVDKRTVRRYIMMLQDLGIPIETERGRYGGYRIQAGYKLPPLMFTNDEALSVVLGLLVARKMGLTGAAPDTEGALAKIERVLPGPLREQVQAVQEALKLDLAPVAAVPATETVILLSQAVRGRQPVWIRYKSGGSAQITERVFNPYSVVYRGGRWYAVGHCQLRNDLRCFRLERIFEVEPYEGSFTPPPDFDSVAFLLESLARVPEEWEVELILHATLEEARRIISPALAILEETNEGVRFRASASSLDWFARELASYPFPFTIVRPDALRDALRQRAPALHAAADRTDFP
jgi:predicted DNA-binding transcriptional regulator YafY